MYSQIISQSELKIVSLKEAKAQCRVFTDFEDAYVSSLIKPYCEFAQEYTKRMLSTGEAVVVVEEYCKKIQLPFGKVTEVTEVLIDDVATTDFTFNQTTQKVKINSYFSEAQITFKAGYEEAPGVVTQAILIAISTAFANRDDVVIGQTVATMPMTSLNLLDKVRYHGT